MALPAAPPRPARRRGRTVLRLAALLVACLLAWWALAWFLQRPLLFPRERTRPFEAAKRALAGLVELGLEVSGGRVEAWYVPAPSAAADRPAGLVVFSHGNAELIDDQVELVRAYQELGLSVLLPEYRGYGRSAGEPSEESLVGDAAASLARVLARAEVDATRVVHHGRSLGAGVACALALRRAPAALVLESAFRSVPALAARLAVPAFVVRDRFDNEAALRAFAGPVLLMHGRADDVVPFEHAETLAGLARHARLVAHDGGHNDRPSAPQGPWPSIAAFLREHGVVR